MNFVDSIEIGGIPASQIPSIKGKGSPTNGTEGAVGCLYMDTDTGDLYKCTAVNDGVYTWVVLCSGVGGSIEGAVLYTQQTLSEDQQAQTRQNIGALAEKQGTEKANLPLVVGEDGAAAPAKLTPSGIDGAAQYGTAQNSSASSDLTESWKDGYFVSGPRNGGSESADSSGRLCVGTTGDVIPNAEYEFESYYDPSVSTNPVLCFYNSTGQAITNMEGSTVAADWNENYYTFTEYEKISNNRFRIRVIAPATASYARYNVGSANKELAYFRRVQQAQETQGMYSLDWLAVTEENITPACKETLCDQIQSSLEETIDEQIASSLEEAIGSFTNESRLKYGNSLKKPFGFSGKSIAAFGDSITAGVASPGLASVDSYAKRFATMHNMTYAPWAISGSCICDAEDAQYSIYKRITQQWTGTADFAIIAGGVNDFTQGKPLGEYNSTDITTFYGALRGICDFLSTNHPDMNVIFITPINCTHSAPDAVLPLNHYRNAIFEVATEYGFNVVDGSQLGFPDETGGFQEFMLNDGVHPTDAGHSFYAKSLSGILC